MTALPHVLPLRSILVTDGLGKPALLRAGSMAYPRKKVGAWARVGLGSVVLRNVPDHATVFGNPAQRVHLNRPA